MTKGKEWTKGIEVLQLNHICHSLHIFPLHCARQCVHVCLCVFCSALQLSRHKAGYRSHREVMSELSFWLACFQLWLWGDGEALGSLPLKFPFKEHLSGAWVDLSLGKLLEMLPFLALSVVISYILESTPSSFRMPACSLAQTQAVKARWESTISWRRVHICALMCVVLLLSHTLLVYRFCFLFNLLCFR